MEYRSSGTEKVSYVGIEIVTGVINESVNLTVLSDRQETILAKRKKEKISDAAGIPATISERQRGKNTKQHPLKRGHASWSCLL